MANDIKNKLIAKLREIYDNRDFVAGVISNATHPEDRKEILKYIENGNDVTIDNIILLSVHLDQKRYG